MGKKKSKPTQQSQTETPATAAKVDAAAPAAPAKAAAAPAATPAKKQEAPKKAAPAAAAPVKAAPAKKAAAPAAATPAKKQEAPKKAAAPTAATPAKVAAAKKQTAVPAATPAKAVAVAPAAASKKQEAKKAAAVVVAAPPQEIVAVPGFFGHVVAPGQKLQWANEVEEFVLQLNSAALGATVKKGRSTLFVVAKDAKIALCTLVPDAVEQFALAHTFTPFDGAIEFVVEGVNAIHLTGFIDVQDDDEDEAHDHEGHRHDFDDSDDESMDSDEDEMMVFGDQSDSELEEDDDETTSSEERFEVIDERIHGDDAPVAKKTKQAVVAPVKKAEPVKKVEPVKKAEPTPTPAKKKAAAKEPVVTPASAPLTKKQLAAAAKTEQKIADKVAELTTPPSGGKKRAAPAAASVDVPKKAKTSAREYKGVTIDDAAIGKGQQAMKGRKVSILYTGRLESNGKQFDSNQNRKKPFTFRHGIGDVIKGMDIGIEGMRAGGKRTIVIPAKLGYGKVGAGPSIPGNANLIFEIEML